MTSGIVRITQPKKVYVFWSKFLGGTMWFWILWRLKHDWPDVVVSVTSYKYCSGPFVYTKCTREGGE